MLDSSNCDDLRPLDAFVSFKVSHSYHITGFINREHLKRPAYLELLSIFQPIKDFSGQVTTQLYNLSGRFP